MNDAVILLLALLVIPPLWLETGTMVSCFPLPPSKLSTVAFTVNQRMMPSKVASVLELSGAVPMMRNSAH